MATYFKNHEKQRWLSLSRKFSANITLLTVNNHLNTIFGHQFTFLQDMFTGMQDTTLHTIGSRTNFFSRTLSLTYVYIITPGNIFTLTEIGYVISYKTDIFWVQLNFYGSQKEQQNICHYSVLYTKHIQIYIIYKIMKNFCKLYTKSVFWYIEGLKQSFLKLNK